MGVKNCTQFLSRANIKAICSELIDSREAIINSLEFRRCFMSNERTQNLANAPMAIWKVVLPLYTITTYSPWPNLLENTNREVIRACARLFCERLLTFWFYNNYSNNYKHRTLSHSTMTVVNRIYPSLYMRRERERERDSFAAFYCVTDFAFETHWNL